MDTMDEHQTGRRHGRISMLCLVSVMVSVMVSVFGSERVELRENRDFGDSLQKRRSPLESAN